MTKAHTLLIFLLLAGFLLVNQSAFIVRQGEQSMVLQFGKPVNQFTEPGLKFKTPFVQQVKVFPQKILSIDPDQEEVILSDQKRLVVDTFARYRIVDMLTFNNTLSNRDQAEAQLDNIINSTARAVLGTVTLDDLLSEKRDDIMGRIRDEANKAVKDDKGVEIIDVRIIRADLPEQTVNAVYQRMITQRTQEATKYRGEGAGAAQATTSDADKQRTIIMADAQKQAQILRGEGEAEATRIYAEAFKKDPDFYAFYRSMQAYRESLSGDNTTMILAPDGDFFRYFKDSQGAPARK
jgi:membrane protease subunit HflC